MLRSLLEDPRSEVRLEAFRTLASDDDSVAIKKISDALENRDTATIRAADAIELLDVAGSVNHVVVLRPYLVDPDPDVQARAVHALAVDPESRDQIVALVRSSDTKREVRVVGLQALSRADADFSRYATSMLSDRRVDEAVRATALRTLIGHLNYQQVGAEEQVRAAEAVEGLLSEEPTILMRADPRLDRDAARKELLDALRTLRDEFPAVRQHYEQRQVR